jgi:hypothetical protein
MVTLADCGSAARCRKSSGMRRVQKAKLGLTLLDPKLEIPVAVLTIIGVPAWTLHLPTAGIGTELLADRDKIEMTPLGLPFERSPVPLGRAHRHDTRAVFALPRRSPQTPDWSAEQTGFEVPRPLAVPQANFDYCGRFLASAQASEMIAEPKCNAF